MKLYLRWINQSKYKHAYAVVCWAQIIDLRANYEAEKAKRVSVERDLKVAQELLAVSYSVMYVYIYAYKDRRIDVDFFVLIYITIWLRYTALCIQLLIVRYQIR